MDPAAGSNNPRQAGLPRRACDRRKRGNDRAPRRGQNSNPQQPDAEVNGIVTAGTAASPSRRPSRRGRGRGRARTTNGRTFDGELTLTSNASNEPPSRHPTSSLLPDAPEFQPGQVLHALPEPSTRPKARKRRASKSTAPDLSTRIHEDIDRLQYECAICTNNVQRNSLVWSCRSCWTVFHFSCVKKWSESALAERQQQLQNRDSAAGGQWRCPGCNLPQEEFPENSACWCEKEVGHRSIPGLPPFSCGQTCSRQHVTPKKCPHPCQEICHAGPCPPCPNMGLSQMCFCGRKTVTRKCMDTDYDHGWSCGAVCGELMPCGKHQCTRTCHEGLCGACEELVLARCYCGKIQKQIVCSDRGDETDSAIGAEFWIGIFNCGNRCERTYDCLQHKCEKLCHAQDAAAPHCPRSPDVVNHCPCGKTALSQLSAATRQSCDDPIPNCTRVCEKVLACGHLCQQVCHSGDCSPCLKTVSINCRCGRTSLSMICHQGTEEQPQCMRVCRATLNCGRHQCDERCCSGERKATERQAGKRKYQRPNADLARALNDDFEAEHICTLTCGRLLKCGNHTCQELCHRGPCGSCREAIFDDLSCHCGRTVLQSPLPCGTKPPPCRYECERAKACGHPQVSHNCHLDGEECPRCPFLTTKFCMCGKHQMKNQPCWLAEARCGEICGQRLKSCGLHTCRKPCHKPGECEDVRRCCLQECGKEKSCGHQDSAPCHGASPCREDKQCQHKMIITCACQRMRKEVSCHATKHTRGNLDKTIECDDECRRLERNRQLATALNINPETHKDDYIPYSAETLNMFLGASSWAQAQEKEFRMLAADPAQKRVRFKPMQSHQRAFLHSLAEDFGFDSLSMDPEPHRHVTIFRTPRFVTAPTKTLAECARIRHRQGLASVSAAAIDAKQKAKLSNVVGEPYNGMLVTNVSFGLTAEQLRAAIRPVMSNQTASLEVDIEFLPSGDVVLLLKPNGRSTSTPQYECPENLLSAIKPSLARQINVHSYGSLQLCRVDSSLNVVRREMDSTANGGWSQVAAKAAAPKRPKVQQWPVGKNSTFTVLESSATRKKQSKEVAQVADDWEAAENMEEAKEVELQAVAANASSDDTPAAAEKSGNTPEIAE